MQHSDKALEKIKIDGFTFRQLDGSLYGRDPRIRHEDYQAFHPAARIGITELCGKRHYQEDTVSAGRFRSRHLALISDADYKTISLDVISLLQDCITHLGYGRHQGSTLCANLIKGRKVWTSHLGDSLALVCVINKEGKVVEFRQLNTILHNPNTPSEKARIEEMGAIVSEGRIGNFKNVEEAKINISRTIGDESFVAYGLTHNADTYFNLIAIPEGGKAFLITACDGLTERNCLNIDNMTSLMEAWHTLPVEDIAAKLAQEAIVRGSYDNISVMVTLLDLEENDLRYMAVFDGHGGDQVSTTLSHLFNVVLIIKLQTYILQAYLSETNLSKNMSHLNIKLNEACRMIYQLFNEFVEKNKKWGSIELFFKVKEFYIKLALMLDDIITILPDHIDELDKTQERKIDKAMAKALVFSELVLCVSVIKYSQQNYFPPNHDLALKLPSQLVIQLMKEIEVLTIDNMKEIYKNFLTTCYACLPLYRAAGLILNMREAFEQSAKCFFTSHKSNETKRKVMDRLEQAVWLALEEYPAKSIVVLLRELKDKLNDEEESLASIPFCLKLFSPPPLKELVSTVKYEVKKILNELSSERQLTVKRS